MLFHNTTSIFDESTFFMMEDFGCNCGLARTIWASNDNENRLMLFLIHYIPSICLRILSTSFLRLAINRRSVSAFLTRTSSATSFMIWESISSVGSSRLVSLYEFNSVSDIAFI